MENFLAEIDDVDEEMALEMLAAFEKEQARPPEKRRTWKQNKDRKAAARKDRRVFNRPRLSVNDLKARTRCASCGERGHWRAECKKPYRSKEERGKGEGKGSDQSRPAVAFVYLGALEDEAGSSTFVGWTGGGHSQTEVTAPKPTDYTINRENAKLDLEPQADSADDGKKDPRREHVVARAAGGRDGQRQPALLLCAGSRARHPRHWRGPGLDWERGLQTAERRLREQGLRSLRLASAPPSAHGVGGKAMPLFQALIPWSILAGVPGVVRVTVIEESIPHLISVGLLEATGAAIDMRRNTVSYQELGVSEPMLRLKSGHRAVDIAAWRGGSFPTPPHEEFGLTDGAFNLGTKLTGSIVEAYMVVGSAGGSEAVSVHGADRQESAPSVSASSSDQRSDVAEDGVVCVPPLSVENGDAVNVPPKPLAQSGSKTSRAERYASHGKRPRAQVEETCDESSLPPGAPREAGGGPAMPSSGRLRGQWGKSVWVGGAVCYVKPRSVMSPTGPSRNKKLGKRSRMSASPRRRDLDESGPPTARAQSRRRPR